MGGCCDLVVALHGLHIERSKVPVPLATDFFRLEACSWPCFNKCYWDFLTELGITYPHQSHMNVSQGSETSKSQSYLLFLCIASCRSVLTIIVVNLSLKWGLMPGHNHMITVYNGAGEGRARASHAMTRRRTCNNLGTNFNYMVTWEWDFSL